MSGYFDNSATTKPSEKALEAFIKAGRECFGNPASLHSMGLHSHIAVEAAREALAKRLSANPDEIFFTSGGTESNNIALIGSAFANRRRGNRIVISNIEHPSVDRAAEHLSENGFEVIRLHVTEDGDFSDDELPDAINKDTVLVSSMLVNNETGLILNTEKLKNAIRKNAPDCILHIDAVQAFGKLDINVNKLGCDLLSVSAHKIHALKGVGALYKRKGTRIKPIGFGGGQESGLRSGTVPVELICAFKAAVDQIDTKSDMRHFEELRTLLLQGISDTDHTVNFENCGQRGILSIAFKGIKSEVMLHFLSERGFYVSSGSACSKGKKSTVLKNLGLTDDITDSTLRISFSRYNTTDETRGLAGALKDAVSAIARKK